MAARRSRARKPIINKDEYTGVLKDMIIRTGEINPEGGSLYLSPAALKLARKAQAAKFPFLWHFFNIDPKSEDRWELLAKALAERCVPGMRIAIEHPRKKATKPPIWKKDGTEERFKLRVDEIMSGGKKKKPALIQAGKEFGSKADVRSLANHYASGEDKLSLIEARAAIFSEANPKFARLLGL